MSQNRIKLLTSCAALVDIVVLFGAHAAAQRTSGQDRRTSIHGVVIESVSQNGIAQKAGLRRGDILARWTRQESAGLFRSPFDLSYVQLDQGNRGRVIVEVYRRGSRFRRVLASGSWGIRARPPLSADLLSIYRSGRKRIDEGHTNQGVRIWQAAIAQGGQEPAGVRRWLLSRIAEQFASVKRWTEVDSSLSAALEAADDADHTDREELLHQWGQSFENRDDLVAAERCYRQMLHERQELATDSIAVGAAFSNIGIVLLKKGNLSEAETMFRRALAIDKKIAPSSRESAVAVANVGVVLDQKGELAQADYFYRSALLIEEHTPGLLRQYSITLVDLGILNYERGDLPRAQQYFRKAMAIAQDADPNSLDIATIFSDLSLCLLKEGHAAAAEQYELRSLSIRERQAPHSVSVAFNLLDLGKIARTRGMLARAESFYRRALDLLKELPPPHPELASALSALADVMSDEGKFVEAESIYRRTLAVIETTTLQGPDHAQAVADLARVLRKQGHLQAARPLYAKALGEYETLAAELGGFEQDLLAYRAKYHALASDYLGLLMENGEQTEAFEFADSFRCRVMAQLLLEEHLKIRNGANSDLLKSEQALRTKIRASAETRLGLLPTTGPTRDVEQNVTDLEARYKEVERQIRNNGGKYAALMQPRQLSLAGVQRLLDSDTLLLEYALGREQSFLWVVGQNSFQSFQLGPRFQIEAVAHRLYQGVSKSPVDLSRMNSGENNREYQIASRLLSKLVLSPAAEALGKKRLAIVADGPLEYIPFAVLPDPGHPAVPLIVDHELVTLPSAAVLGELRLHRPAEVSFKGEVAVLADPVLNLNDERVMKSSATRDPKLHGTEQLVPSIDMLAHSASDTRMVRRGEVHLARLFYTRSEAESIVSVFGQHQVLQALGFKATRALALSPEISRYRIVHFATHGLVDSQRPEFSGLVLSLINSKGQPEDGFVQLDDIYNLNLPVELVVLSGCETALGRDVEGEGLIGMTRGFMYAGASRVVASMWSVSDLATSELMAKFYRAIKKRKIAPAAALRWAQIQMWNEHRWHDPYYWAAFKLEGDWN